MKIKQLEWKEETRGDGEKVLYAVVDISLGGMDPLQSIYFEILKKPVDGYIEGELRAFGSDRGFLWSSIKAGKKFCQRLYEAMIREHLEEEEE